MNPPSPESEGPADDATAPPQNDRRRGPRVLQLGFVIGAIVGPLVVTALAAMLVGIAAAAVAGAVLAAFGVRAVLLSNTPPVTSDSGIAVDRASEPSLFAAIDRAVTIAEADSVDEVVLVHDVDLFVTCESRLLGLVPQRRVLAVGVGLLDTVRVDEFTALLVRELRAASASTPDAAVVRGREAALAAPQHTPRWPIDPPILAYLGRFARSAETTARHHALSADALAGQRCGVDATSGALRMQSVASAAFGRYLEEYAAPLWDEGSYPVDLYAGFRSFLTDPARRSYLGELRQHQVSNVEDLSDGTPALRQRLAVIARVEQSELAGERPDPARDLLTDPSGTEERMSARLASVATASPDMAATRLDDPEAPVWTRRQLRMAVTLADAARRARPDDAERGLRLALQAFGADAVSIASLLDGASNSLVPDGPPLVVRDHLRAAIGMALVDHADCRWQVDFGGPVQLVGPDAQRVPLDDWLDELAADPARHGTVATWLTQVGVPLPAAA